MEATWWTQPDQLDAEQRKVVALPPDGNHLVLGPPGSGKTNLLLLRAAYLHRMGRRNIAVITFNRILREFLATGTEASPFDVNKIQTYVNWGARILRQNGDELENGASFDEVRRKINEGISALDENILQENKLDCILVDEAQDYTEEEINILKRCCNQIFAVGDDRQRIYQSEGALRLLSNICGGSTLLHHNYRSSLKICRLADSIRNELNSPQGLEATSNYDEKAFPSTVLSVQVPSLEEQVEKASEQISRQLRAYQSGIIGVLSPRTAMVRRLGRLFEDTMVAGQMQRQQYVSGYQPISNERRVIISTIHGAKGLEFRALHLMAMDTLQNFPKERKVAYTAVTRAKTSLTVYGSGALPGYLDQALNDVDPAPKREPQLNELFAGKK